MIETLKVDFKPSTAQLGQIKAWLIAEDHTLGEGFFCNWGVIEDPFDNKRICTLLLGKKAVGFITWFERDKVTTIQISNILTFLVLI